MACQSPWRILLIVGAFLAFWAAIFINAMASLPAGIQLGIMRSSTQVVSNKYDTKITPTGATFSIWGAIYFWQALLLVYGLATICIPYPKTGSHIYNDPEIIPFYFYVVYIVNMILNLAWIFLFDREQLAAGVVVIALMAVTLYVCNIASYRRLESLREKLVSDGQQRHVWLVRLIVQNGIAFYATWITIATLLNFIMCLVYLGGVDMATACWIALAILNAEVIAWFILETFVFDIYLRYTFSPYIVLCIALSGSVQNNYNPLEPLPYSIYTIVLLALSGTLLAIKIFVMFWRHFRSPIGFFVPPASNPEKKPEMA